MRLAVITDEVSEALEEAIPFMLQHGVEAAELRGLWGTNIAEIDRSTRDQAARLLRAAGLPVCSIASPLYKTDLCGESGDAMGPLHLATPVPRECQIELLQRCLELAHFFEAPLVRIFSFWRRGKLTPKIEERIVAALLEALPYAERAGVILALENEYSCYIGTGAQTRRILEQIHSPFLRVCWDPGNAFCDGEDPIEGYRAVQPWVVHLHVKDAVCHDGVYHWTVVGEGQVPYKEQFRLLREESYSGYLSLETHAKIEGLTSAEVSALCLKAMRRLIEEVSS